MTEKNRAGSDRRLLKLYLSQYYRATEKRKFLQRRLEQIQADLNNPGVSAPPLDGIPDRNQHGAGAASLTYKKGDVEARIQNQIEIQIGSIIDIMEILEFLPEDSIERDIMEYRFIDCKSFSEICDMVHLTRSPCYEHFNRGLDKLLTYKKVRRVLEDYEDRITRLKKDSY